MVSSRNSSLEQTRFLSKTVKLHQPKCHTQHHVLDLLSATIEPKSVDKRTTIESIEQEQNQLMDLAFRFGALKTKPAIKSRQPKLKQSLSVQQILTGRKEYGNGALSVGKSNIEVGNIG